MYFLDLSSDLEMAVWPATLTTLKGLGLGFRAETEILRRVVTGRIQVPREKRPSLASTLDIHEVGKKGDHPPKTPETMRGCVYIYTYA